jgi:hypothetical protein
MGRSPHELLEHAPAAAATDQDRPICCRPHHLALGQREPREGPEALPHRSFERVTELVPGRPSLDLDQALGLHPEEIDPLRLPSAAGPTPERHDHDRGAPSLKLFPHRRSPHQLATRRPQPRRVYPRRRAPLGVEQRSPIGALQVGHGRSSQPRATCSCAARTMRPPPTGRPRDQRLHRAPGAAPHSGHHCSSQTVRSLTARTPFVGARTGATACRGGLDHRMWSQPPDLMDPRWTLCEPQEALRPNFRPEGSTRFAGISV